MASTFLGLEIGKRSLFAQQAALSTTGHNISNSNSVGFTRQRVELVAARSISYPGMNNDRSPRQLGAGVEPAEIVRIREDYLDQQYRWENKFSGYWEQTRDIYAKIEGIINEPSDTGIQSLMNQFWQSWQDLAKNPESLADRAVVVERGVTLASGFKHMMDSLDQLDADLTNVIGTKIDEVNSIADQIHSLNEQIRRLVPHGHTPNDLYDKRDLLIDELSRLVDVEVESAEHGTVEVKVGGQTLVSPTTGVVEVSDIEDLNLTSGEILALKDGKETVVSDIRNQINLYANEFVSKVNEIHEGGFNLNGEKKGDSLFIVNDNQNVAGSIIVNPALINSLDLIAAAKTKYEGDGGNAQEIASIKFKSIDINGQNSTLDDHFRLMISQLGIRSKEALRKSENSEILIHQIDNQRQSVSGVSLDEEMTNMIKYQQAYNAAARFVTAIDEILDKVVNGMGRVGL